MGTLLDIILSIIFGGVTIGAASAASVLFYEDQGKKGDLIQIFSGGLIVGLINFFAPVVEKNAPWIAWLFLGVMFLVSAVLILWWHKEGSNFIEMIPILVLTVFVFFTTKAAASAASSILPGDFLKSLVMILPMLVMVGSIGFYLVDLFQFRIDPKYEGRERRYE